MYHRRQLIIRDPSLRTIAYGRYTIAQLCARVYVRVCVYVRARVSV